MDTPDDGAVDGLLVGEFEAVILKFSGFSADVSASPRDAALRLGHFACVHLSRRLESAVQSFLRICVWRRVLAATATHTVGAVGALHRFYLEWAPA